MGSKVAGKKAKTAAVSGAEPTPKKVKNGGSGDPSGRDRAALDHHDVDGDNGAGREPAVLPVGTAVIVRPFNGNDSSKTGVVEAVSEGERLVHLSDGRHINFVISQLTEPAPQPPDEYE